MEVIKLNLIPTGALPVVHASQYDDGRTFRADLYDGAEVYHLDGTETISCELKKPDGNIVTLAVTNTSESFIEIQTTEQACAVAGESLAEVKIEKGADKIGSLNFILSVERSPIEGGISSASEINNLWTQVDGMVADILADSYDSADVIFDNEPTEGHGIPYTVTSEGIGIAIDDALEMTELASGAIATFESEYALPLRGLEIEINAVETGDGNPKSPSNPYTISGFTGSNIKQFGANLISGDTYQLGANVVLLGESAGDTYSTYLKATTYTISFKRPTSKTFRLDLTDSNGVQTRLINAGTATSKTFTIATEGFYKFGTYLSGGMTSSDIADVMLVEGSEVEPYTAYVAPTTTPITWQDEAGTVYGGTLDVTSGVLTVTWGGVDMGSLTWTYDSTYQRMKSNSIADMKKVNTARTLVFMCPIYQVISDGRSIANVPNDSIYASFDSDQKTAVWVHDSNYTDAGVFKTAMSGIYIVYPLETPLTYQLTPTQISAIVGTNNIFTDTNGDTSLEYYTKRGEQTVRIAEGVAVDVINNKSIDTLTTTDKTVKGAINELDADIANTYTKTEVDTALALKFDNANRVTTGTGTFPGLLNTADRVWLITAQRLSTNNTLMLIAHKQNGNFYFKEIVKDAGMEYNYNSENGSVVITYGGSTTGVYGGAYRLA